VRPWIVRLSLLALVIASTHPAWAAGLNDQFTFPHITYNQYFPSGAIIGHGTGGQFEGMGDVTIFFRYSPDPEGGHPLARTLRFDGVIPELGITEESLLFAGVIIDDPTEFPGFLRFNIADDAVHPVLAALVGFNFGDTWDVPLPLAVPAPAAGLLVATGVLLLAMRVRRLI
jgi:hypothetical protein